MEITTEMYGNMQVEKDHNIHVIWFHASHAEDSSMAVVRKRMCARIFPHQADHSLTIVWRHANHTNIRI